MKITIVILLIICQYANSKEMNTKKDIMNFYTNEQVGSLSQKAVNLLNQSSCKSSADNMSIVYIFKYDYNDSLKKKDFLDNSFFRKLMPSKHKILVNDKEYIDANFLLEKKDGTIIGSGNAYNFYPERSSIKGNRLTMNQFILNEMKKLKISHLFMINKLANWPVFGVTDDNQVFVFDYSNKKPKAFPLDEFIKNRSNSVFEKWDVDNK
ncbi:hypothetical protein [Dysgonomonas macrotermitis]|nr:hypothetical protein [Dysgonomonas macrotermitis]